ncbi:hypothetical protein [Streptomyces sp. NPDC057854]|uniref:hypothetical protein n=1 Tax=unclassified Streptomyces TaxID=2593676 RepID=UPI0036749E05
MDADFLIAHHDRLAAWLSNGEAGSLDAFLGAHHESFALVTAEGEVLGLEALAEALRGAGGSRPGLAIRVEEVTAVAPGVCRFLERHVVDGSVVAERVVTAVARDGALLAVQETARRPAAPDEAEGGYGQV